MSTAREESTFDGGDKRYFCHQCRRTVLISPSADLSCPNCQGGFIEEISYPSPNLNLNRGDILFSDGDDDEPPFLPFHSHSRSLPDVFSALLDLRSPESNAARGVGSGSDEPPPFDPLVFLRNYIESITDGRGNVQFILERAGGSGGGGVGFQLGGNLGDYFIGPGLEQLIESLAENDPNRYGTPPAAKKAMSDLPDVKITEGMVASDHDGLCAVCKEEFELGEVVKMMPCRHVYHKDCIFPWLELHNSCPVCRFELPTDDADYENRKKASDGCDLSGRSPNDSGSASSIGGSENLADRQIPAMERRFIQLPWPFGSFGQHDDNSGERSGERGGGPSGGRM